MPIWNEVDISFLEHLMICERGMKYAEQKQLSLAEQQNLLLQTLPLDYQYVAAFVDDASKVSMAKFTSKLMELIMGTNWEQSSWILNASRRSGEKILSYFLRLMGMYQFCTSKSEADLENDQWFCMMLFQKILDTLPLGAKAEFQRDCEMSMENGHLKFPDLKKKIITCARKAPIFERQQLSNQVNPVLQQKGQSIEGSERSDRDVHVPSIRSTTDKKQRTEERRSCFYCGKVRHLIKNCYKKQRDDRLKKEKSENANSNDRESTTDGRRDKN